MNRRYALLAVAVALTCVLFATVSTSGGVDLWGEPQWSPNLGERERVEIDIDSGDRALERIDPANNNPILVPGWFTALLRVLWVTAVIAGSIWLSLAAWRNRPRLRFRRRLASEDFDVIPDVAAAVVDQAAAQRAAMLGGEPRNAIVRCWLQLEADVAAAGLERHSADTSLEFTERVLTRYAVDPEAINELAAWYREARFSDHHFDESDRQAALAALDRLHETLRESSGTSSSISSSETDHDAVPRTVS